MILLLGKICTEKLLKKFLKYEKIFNRGILFKRIKVITIIKIFWFRILNIKSL